MLELTQEQKALVSVIRDKWINKINNPKPFKKEKAIQAVEWLYKLARLGKPEVIVCDSPLGCQLAINTRDKKFCSPTGLSMRGGVDHIIADALDYLIIEPADYAIEPTENNIIKRSWHSVDAISRRSVYHPVTMSLKYLLSGILDYYSCDFCEIRNFEWSAYYEYNAKIGVIENDKLNEWLEYCDSGIFYSMRYEGVCFICPIPKYIKRNNEQAMHCEDGYAIEWADGYGIYVLDGVPFDREGQDELYWKIVRKELSLPEILQIEDIDQRAMALKHCNAGIVIADLIKQGQAELVDTATKQASYLVHDSVQFVDGIAQINFLKEKPAKIQKTLEYKLYKVNIPEILENEYMLVYPHASVQGLSYWKGVDPETAKGGSLASIAEYHNMSVNDYLLSTSQS